VTATQVDGVEVISTEPATSHWKDGKGTPIEYRQMLRLLLADGRELYGCLHCDYTHESLNSVRPHLNAHRKEKLAAAAAAGPSVGGLSLAELARVLSTADQTAADRDEWKRRALKAEGQLRSLRKALGVKA
jgi:hypothetical protein